MFWLLDRRGFEILLSLLQVEYQHNVHLIRGNHEAADINALFGFRIECIERMVMYYASGSLVSIPCLVVSRCGCFAG